MMQSNLLQILPKLTSDELKIVQQFLEVNFFNGGPRKLQTRALWAYLMRLKPTFDDEKRLAPERVCKSIGLKSARELTYVTSELLAVVQKALQHVHLGQEHETQRHLRMAEIFGQRGLNDLFMKSIGRARRALDRSEQHDLRHYHDLWVLEKLLFESRDFHTTKHQDLTLKSVAESFDRFYIGQRLMYMAQLAAGRAFSNAQLTDEVQLIPIDLGALPRFILDEPLMAMLVHFVTLQSSETIAEEAVFEALVAEVNRQQQTVPFSLLVEIHSYLRSYASIAYNKGHTQYLELLFRMFHQHLEAGTILSENGEIHPASFQNIVTVALKLGHFRWADDTVEAYKNRISGEQPDLIYAYNKANCLFHLRAYEQALDILPDTFPDSQTDINAKRLRLKILFELHSPLLPYAIDTFAVNDIFRNQQRGKYPPIFIEVNNNFLKFMRALSALPPRPSRADLVSLADRLRDTQRIAEREWLQHVMSRYGLP